MRIFVTGATGFIVLQLFRSSLTRAIRCSDWRAQMRAPGLLSRPASWHLRTYAAGTQSVQASK